MKYTLNKKIKNPTMIQGFPSLGLVSTITTKFLTDHLDVEEVGYIESDKITPLTAIHKGKILHPITIYYNKKYNLLIIQSLAEVTGLEWDLASTIKMLANEVEAKELIVIEGVQSKTPNIKLFYHSNKSKLNLTPLEEGIVTGTTAALLLEGKELPLTCIFAEAHSELPDSEAAAKVVDALDNHLNLNLDYKPLLEDAKKFEGRMKKLKSMMELKQQMGGQPMQMPEQEPEGKKTKKTKAREEAEDVNYFG